jgi:hypothetical protein
MTIGEFQMTNGLRVSLVVAALVIAPLAYASNDDGCEITVAPAATLLLPYFEVDFKSTASIARTTLFTVTNTSPYPQIAHVVLWTDWAYPALNFNIWLTGYDVQSINLYDIFLRGAIAPISSFLAGTSFQPGGKSGLSPVGTGPNNPPNGVPNGNASNPNHDHSGAGLDVSIACLNQPGQLTQQVVSDLQLIFTTGTGGVSIGAGCTGKIGGVHANAVGFVTIDVSNTCNTSFPGPTSSGQSYSSEYLLYDNVLIGDYQDVTPNASTGNYAGGNPMVHIRAVPEGGPIHSNPGTDLPYTFYDRYNLGGNTFGAGTLDRSSGSNRKVDRRQPLPSTFAARYIEGGATGFTTNYKIWREGITGPSANGCGASNSVDNVFLNSTLKVTEVVRFDEHENSNSVAPPPVILPPPSISVTFPAASSTATINGKFPSQTGSGDVAGWMYLNLDNNNGAASAVYSDPSLDDSTLYPTFSRAKRASQNWVVVSMLAEGRYSVDFDAAPLGNGSTPAVARGESVGPKHGVFNTTDDVCDIAVGPAATLLLPYFEVDFKTPSPTARTTLFTVTNTSPYPQIAHVVLWTDWAYAVLNFNIWLTGYDVQSINLYDIFNRGVIAPVSATLAGTSYQPGGTTGLSPLGANPPNLDNSLPHVNNSNPNHDHSNTPTDVSIACVNQPGVLPTQYLIDLQNSFTTGSGGISLGAGCTGKIGGVHADAIGYITIDVSNTCNIVFPGPTTAGESYSSQYLLYDNVLIGDYQDVSPNQQTGNYAGGGPLVHIKAVPEGGPAHSFAGTPLPYTFYDRLNLGGDVLGAGSLDRSSGANRLVDRRQPLPSTFAARFIQGGTGGFSTNFKIWREAITGPTTTCGTTTLPTNAKINSALTSTEVVRFDEHENSNNETNQCCCILCPPVIPFTLPAAAPISADSPRFPAAPPSGDVAGWMVLNLDNHNVLAANKDVYSDPSGNNPAKHPAYARGLRASQNWVIVSMFAEGRYSVDFDAASLGNGCSPVTSAGTTAGPAGGVFVCPPLLPGTGYFNQCTTQGGFYVNTTPFAGQPTTGTSGTNVTP